MREIVYAFNMLKKLKVVLFFSTGVDKTNTRDIYVAVHFFPDSPQRPECQQMYNLFHASDPSAFRIEPLLNYVFRQIPPIKVSRYNKYPMGDGESIQIGKTTLDSSILTIKSASYNCCFFITKVNLKVTNVHHPSFCLDFRLFCIRTKSWRLFSSYKDPIITLN